MANLSPDEEIESLRRELERHNRLYYVDAKPEITDREYDVLMAKLIALETAHPELYSPNSPSKKVGGGRIPGFEPVTHRIPMLSIENAFEEQELVDWDAGLRKTLEREAIEYTVEYKIDGVALALIWENGTFVQAVTRGNGAEGDDVTFNARLMPEVPWNLQVENPPATFEVRGEVIILNEAFSAFQAGQIKDSEDPAVNPRSAAAGMLKLLEHKKRRNIRMLRFLAHGMGYVEGISWNTYSEFLKSIQAYGIPTTPNVSRARGFDQLRQVCNDMIANVSDLPFQVDGLVIKIDSLEDREQLGITAKCPRWVRAYKWERYEAQTRIAWITLQVGKTGILTPVAELEPVEIDGTTVSRSSLHNRDELDRLGIRIGDLVVVEKAGKIIPHILRVNEAARTGKENTFEYPIICPECATPVQQEEGGVYIRCPNPGCPARLRETLIYFGSRPAMNIDGLGEELVNDLLDWKMIDGIPSLYRLSNFRDELITKKGFVPPRPKKPKDAEQPSETEQRKGKVDKLFDSIEGSKTQPLWRLLTGLNIPLVGPTTARILVREFGTMDEIATQTVESLSARNNIGAAAAQSVHHFFHSQYGMNLLSELKELGLNFGESVGESTGPLSGKVFVITGTLPSLSRDEAEELIRDNGGKSTGSVSKHTSFVLAGESAGSKLTKATNLGIPVISEAEFLAMVEQHRL
ncbi:MAG: NAD-dependent DNA ligase LigA [Planctomycetaceae bacterium]